MSMKIQVEDLDDIDGIDECDLEEIELLLNSVEVFPNILLTRDGTEIYYHIGFGPSIFNGLSKKEVADFIPRYRLFLLPMLKLGYNVYDELHDSFFRVVKSSGHNFDKIVVSSVSQIISNSVDSHVARNIWSSHETYYYTEKYFEYLQSKEIVSGMAELLNKMDFYSILNPYLAEGKERIREDYIERVKEESGTILPFEVKLFPELANEVVLRKAQRTHQDAIKVLKTRLKRRYKITDKLKSKKDLQRYYEAVLKKRLGKQLIFRPAIEIPHTAEYIRTTSRGRTKDIYFQSELADYYIISRLSKADDFIEFMYTLTHGVSKLTATCYREMLLDSLPYNRKVLQVVMYGLKLTTELDFLCSINYFSEEDEKALLQLEKLLYLI